MDIRFSPHNTHLEDPAAFRQLDPQLRLLKQQPLVHRSYLLDELPADTPGIYTIGGGRQVGKTTLMKQWMAKLIDDGIAPERIRFITGELIDDHHSLVRLVSDIVSAMPDGEIGFLILDEVTYIRDWDKGIKYLADAGIIEKLGLFLTGSDLAIIKEARMWFAGRRGASRIVDFHLFPLNFFETVQLKGTLLPGRIDALLDGRADSIAPVAAELQEAFELYLAHGGFLLAINDFAREGRIRQATFSTYSDWIRGDVLKRGKQEHYLREILEAIVKRCGSQITWNALSKDLSIDHPKTVSDYVDLLAVMDAVFVQSALVENKLAAAPKKARKLMFTDPFIFHATRAWLRQTDDPYTRQVVPLLADPSWTARLAEAAVITQYRRYHPTFYIKAEGEVDLAYIAEDRFWPVEVKWTGQIRPKDLKQITKYSNGLILTKSNQRGEILGIPTEPLPLALLRLGEKKRM